MGKKDIADLIKKYEQKQQTGKSIYLDADQFDELAEYFDAQNDIETARDVVDDGLTIHPESNSLQLKKAKFLAYDGEYRKAIHLLENAFSEYDFDLFMLKCECYLQLGLYTEAQSMIQTILDNEAEELDVVLAEIGFLYVEADLFDEAILYFNKSLEYETEKTDVLSDLSYAYEMIGNFEAAIGATNKILDIDPYTYDAWINLGKLQSLQDNFEAAVDAFDFALAINDADTNILKLKAHCLSLCGRTNEAIELFRSLMLDRPYDTSIYFLLAECYQTIGQEDQALACLLQYSETIHSVSKENTISIDEHNLETALEIVKQAMQGKEESEELNMIAGDILFKQNLFEEAKQFFMKAYLLDSENTAIIDRLAIVAIRQEDYVAAIDHTKRVLEIEPDNSIAKQRLTLLYFEDFDNTNFDNMIAQLTDHELHSLFNLIYSRTTDSDLTRDQLIDSLKNAKESRMLFNNISY